MPFASRTPCANGSSIVIVLDLHDLVARAEGPAETLDADLAGRVQRRLQVDVEGAGTEAAPKMVMCFGWIPVLAGTTRTTRIAP